MKGTASMTFSLIIILFWLAFMAVMFKKPLTNFFFRPSVVVEKQELLFTEGISGRKEPYIEGVAFNDSEYAANDVVLKFKLYDKDGVVLGDARVSIDSLLPGERWKFRNSWIPSETTEAKLVEIKILNF